MRNLKFKLMIYALENYYFGYGTRVIHLKNGKIKVYIEDEIFYTDKRQLASGRDELDEEMQQCIYASYQLEGAY